MPFASICTWSIWNPLVEMCGTVQILWGEAPVPGVGVRSFQLHSEGLFLWDVEMWLQLKHDPEMAWAPAPRTCPLTSHLKQVPLARIYPATSLGGIFLNTPNFHCQQLGGARKGGREMAAKLGLSGALQNQAFLPVPFQAPPWPLSSFPSLYCPFWLLQ